MQTLIIPHSVSLEGIKNTTDNPVKLMRFDTWTWAHVHVATLLPNKRHILSIPKKKPGVYYIVEWGDKAALSDFYHIKRNDLLPLRFAV